MWLIGPYRLDPASFVLCRGSETIPIQRRPLDLLLYLITRRGQVIGREELLSEVWQGVVVSEGALSTAVYEVRSALGDLERPPGERWLETVRGRGFRFRGPVEDVAATERFLDGVPFVGRRRIARVLEEELRLAASGQGGVHVIQGTAGIGKTRLVKEVTRQIPAAGVLTVFCEPGGPPLWPWIQLVEMLAPGSKGPGSDAGAAVLERDKQNGGAASNRSSLHFERVERIAELLDRAARSLPLVLVIEDLHWADGASVELLESLAARVRAKPILVFGTFRTEEQAQGVAREVQSSPNVKRDRLEPLSVVDCYALIESILGRVPSPELVGWVRDNSGGVPLMVRELAEQVAAAGESFSEVPQLAHRLLARRFEGLSAETRLALSVAALCGERFDVPLVEAAAEHALVGGRAWVQEGLAKGVLAPVPSNPLRFAFRHALLRDAAEGLLAAEEVAHWHGRLALVLERQHPEPRGAVLSQLARHSAASAIANEDLERPLRYALLAARQALDAFAWEDVRVHSEHVLEWIAFTPPGRRRDAQELEAALLRCAGIASYSGHVEETDALLARAEPLLERVGDAESRALVTGFRFANARNLGDYVEARACADALARHQGLDEVALCWRVSVASLSGAFAEATPDTSWGEAFPEDPRFAEYARRCGRDPGIDRLALTAFAFWATGCDEDALRAARRAATWAEAYADARGRIWALFMQCVLHELRRDWNTLRKIAPEIDSYAERHNITPWLGSGRGFAFWARLQEKESREIPASALASILRDRGHSSSSSTRTLMLLLASRMYAWDRDLESAETAAREGLAECERTDERFAAAELWRQLAGLRRKADDPAGAREAWARGLDVAQAQGHAVAEIRIRCDRLTAADRERLRALRAQRATELGPHERKILQRALA